MEILRQRGFFGRGLVTVASESLVGRYNACLEAIGKQPTACQRFAIDGAGWSPQVAKEKGDPNYLCHGEANLYAILLTPEQHDKPVYMPMHSFDTDLLAEVHRQGHSAIANLTSLSGIVLDIDQGIGHYHHPLDLLMVDSFTVKAFTPGKIMESAQRQRDLVARFRNDIGVWMNREEIDTLVVSAKAHGDLRHKALHLPPVAFSGVRNFYTRALGGVFVFRDSPNREDPLMILESAAFAAEADPMLNLYSFQDAPDLALAAMERAGLVRSYLECDDSSCLESIAKTLHYVLVRAAYEAGCDEDLAEMTSAQVIGWQQKAGDRIPEIYFELDRIRQKRARGGKAGGPPPLPGSELWRWTLAPAPGIDEMTKKVVWQLLCMADPLNIEMTYRHSRQAFYRLYQQWGQGQRRWALNHLNARGLPQNKP